MQIWSGPVGLAVAFVVLVALMLVCFIKARISIWLKVIIIPAVIWYGLAFYYVPSNFMGWSVHSTLDTLPEGAIVYSYLIAEPQKGTDDKGIIYLWLILKKSQHKKSTWFDKTIRRVFDYVRQDPMLRSHSLPYSRETHKKLIEAAEKQRLIRGPMVIGKKKGKKIGKNDKENEEDEDTKGRFEILNPHHTLLKE